MRAVADRLGVRHNTVRWHADSKARLLELVSDELLADCAREPLPDDSRERVRTLARRCRTAMLSHRDGARLIAGVVTAERHTLRYADTVIAALMAAGYSAHSAAWTHWTIFYLTLGIAQEQQATEDQRSQLTPEKVPADKYPALAVALPYLDSDSFDERFEYALDLIVD